MQVDNIEDKALLYKDLCPLCEYDTQQSGRSQCTSICPLIEQYGKPCADLGFEELEGGYSTADWFGKIEGLKEEF